MFAVMDGVCSRKEMIFRLIGIICGLDELRNYCVCAVVVCSVRCVVLARWAACQHPAGRRPEAGATVGQEENVSTFFSLSKLIP